MTTTEYFIVGQGLAGTLLAFEMLENNIDFRIISSPVKSKASNVAAGMINPLVFKRMTKSWILDDLLPVMKSTYLKLESVLNEKFYIEKEILKPLSEQEKQLWLERKSTPEFSNYISFIDDNSAVRYLTKAAAYGIVKGAGYLDLKIFLSASEKYFRENNRIIYFTVDTMNINLNSSFKIKDIKASKMVFCEGYHISSNPIFKAVKINPTKGEVLQIHAPKLSEEYILNKLVFVLPIGKQRFKVGSTYEWKKLNEEPTEKGRASIVERLNRLINVDYSIEKHWAGVRPTVADRRPVLGILPAFEHISVFNGLGTKGVMLAPYFAKEMLKLLMDKKYSTVKEAELKRFYR